MNIRTYVYDQNIPQVLYIHEMYLPYVLCWPRCYSDMILSFTVDFATVVGYVVVSRPFFNLSNPRFADISHHNLMKVSC